MNNTGGSYYSSVENLKSKPTILSLVIEFPFDFTISKVMIWIGCYLGLIQLTTAPIATEVAIIISLFVKSISPITCDHMVCQASYLLATSFAYAHFVLQIPLLGGKPPIPLFC